MTYTLICPPNFGLVEYPPAIYTNDWQGLQLQYSTPRTNYAPPASSFTLNNSGNTLTTGVSAPDGSTGAITCSGMSDTAPYSGINMTTFTTEQSGNVQVSVWATGNGTVHLLDQNSNYFQQITLTGSWQLFTVSANIVTPSQYALRVLRIPSDDTATTMTLYAPMFVPGSILGSYIPTTSSPVTVTDYSISNEQTIYTNPLTPGITIYPLQIYKQDWQGNQLQYSMPRTNYAPQSATMATSVWAKNKGTETITTGIVAPDGSTNAITVSGLAAGYQGILASSFQPNPYTGIENFGVWVKGSGTVHIDQNGSNSTNPTIQVTLSATWTFVSTGIATLTASTYTNIRVLSYPGDTATSVSLAFPMNVLGTSAFGDFIPTTTAPVTVTDFQISNGQIIL